ncbi:hypothetical protein [uncultured Pontibacter sp.]|uniref:hypothetical protein n=1 Tax=uncultured Pontibacter sp. TaxID=453356 RepID=UPI00260C3107|nr:hypothetical protein [uncultured Pontibacter sp.]
MINFFRTLFGFGRPAGNRTVVGIPTAVDIKDAPFVRASNKRLKTLQELYLKYKATAHAEKIKTILEKTKKIHNYLLAKKRVHELELFHIQHTDHFINAFSVIMEVYQRHVGPIAVTSPVRPHAAASAPLPKAKSQQPNRPYVHQTSQRPFEEKVEEVLRKIETETLKGINTAQKVSEMMRRVAGQGPQVIVETLDTKIPALSVPVIAIDTYSKIYYTKELGSAGTMSAEIGYTSPESEKTSFIAHVAAKLKLDAGSLSYMGNTLLALPGIKNRNPAAYAPVLSWNGCAYVLNLQDYRLFPVKTHRKSI